MSRLPRGCCEKKVNRTLFCTNYDVSQPATSKFNHIKENDMTKTKHSFERSFINSCATDFGPWSIKNRQDFHVSAMTLNKYSSIGDY